MLTADSLKKRFKAYMKQNGAVLAKGWLLGLQFHCLLGHDLYFTATRRADELAMNLRKAFEAQGIPFWVESFTNQQFVILTDAQKETLEKRYIFEPMGKSADGGNIARFCTSWATTEEEFKEKAVPVCHENADFALFYFEKGIFMSHKIGITACSNPMHPSFSADLARLCQILRELGFDPVLSPCLYDNGSGFSGTGAERADALMNLYCDPEITDIFDVSGGDMANEVLPYLDFSIIAASGKRFWGYSDLTTIVNAVTTATGNESMLYQVRNLLYDHSAEQITLFQNAFSGQSPSLFDLPCTFLQGDHMEGVMIGGNIRCFLKLAGTDFQPDFRGKILLLEAMGGGVPQMVTFLSQLKMMHAFEQINGILLGTFSQMERDQLTPDMPQLVRQAAGPDLPIARTPYIGHGTDAHAAVIGKFYQISSD